VSRIRLARIFWIGAAAILVAAALVALLAVLRGEFSETDGRIVLTLGALLYTGGAAIAGLALADRGPARRLGLVVAGFAPVALAITVAAIWSFVWEQDNEPWDKLSRRSSSPSSPDSSPRPRSSSPGVLSFSGWLRRLEPWLRSPPPRRSSESGPSLTATPS
jgi:hypothetical protein